MLFRCRCSRIMSAGHNRRYLTVVYCNQFDLQLILWKTAPRHYRRTILPPDLTPRQMVSVITWAFLPLLAVETGLGRSAADVEQRAENRDRHGDDGDSTFSGAKDQEIYAVDWFGWNCVRIWALLGSQGHLPMSSLPIAPMVLILRKEVIPALWHWKGWSALNREGSLSPSHSGESHSQDTHARGKKGTELLLLADCCVPNNNPRQ
jgi:hypothetical protein